MEATTVIFFGVIFLAVVFFIAFKPKQPKFSEDLEDDVPLYNQETSKGYTLCILPVKVSGLIHFYLERDNTQFKLEINKKQGILSKGSKRVSCSLIYSKKGIEIFFPNTSGEVVLQGLNISKR